MSSAYLLGVCAAVAAGITFNFGMVIQKVAVSRTDSRAGLIRQVLRSPLWLGGFALQFFIGSPLNMLAQANIGPAIIPGLMSIGLIVLALSAVWIAKEQINLSDAAGILLVITATALIGFSQLSVEMKSVDLFDPAIVLRLTIFSAAVAAGSLTCHLLQKQIYRARGFLRAVNSGLLYVQSNLWLGVLMGLFGLWSRDGYSPALLLGVALACGGTFAGSMLGVAETQRAFQCSDASRVAPIQIAPQQILSLTIYFLVFNLTPTRSESLPLAASGVALILIGSTLLARRQVALANPQANNIGNNPGLPA